MNTPKINNTFSVRGRLTRDPYYARKDGSPASAVLFTVAASRPFTNASGDLVTATDYVEVKVFNTDEVARLEQSGLNKGAMILVAGRAAAELDTFEKDGEQVNRARLVAVVEATAGHSVEIEQLGKTEDATS